MSKAHPWIQSWRLLLPLCVCELRAVPTHCGRTCLQFCSHYWISTHRYSSSPASSVCPWIQLRSTLRALLGSFHCRKRMLCCLSVPFVPDLFVSGSLRAAQCCSWSLLLSSALFVERPSEEDVFSPDIVKNCNLDHALIRFISPLMPYPATRCLEISGGISKAVNH